jgi:nucleoid-associated protein YgaU
MIRRRLTGLLATCAIAAILVGLPAVLLAVGYGTLPRINSLTDLVDVAMRRDDGTLALLVLKTVGWIAWVTLAVLILTEIVALVPGIRRRELPGLHLPQIAARRLVAAAAALFVALPSSATPAYAAPAQPPTPAVTAPRTVVAATENTATHHARAPGGVSADAPAHPGPTVKTRPYTVKRGESLWSIAAQELGSGRRYTEIAALNTTLLDGKGDGFLQPGWVLQIPQAETEPTTSDPAPSTPDHTTTYTVKKGDTLSGIAREHLGHASSYPRIVDASRAITQPGGRHLTNPDIIDVGWTLNIPTTSPDDPETTTTPPATLSPTATDTQPEPIPATPTPAPPPTTSTPQSTASASATAAGQDTTTGSEDHASVSPGWLLAGLVGAGTILGGSLWLALQRRRAAQSRARRPGRMIATGPPVLAPVEKTLTTAGAGAAPTVEFMDEALRRLATRQGRAAQMMPILAAVELTGTHLTLHLSAGCDLPGPWQPAPDQLHWQLPTGVDLDEVALLDAAVPAPYPQLVTIGAGDDDQLWLLNLEDAAIVQLAGDPEYARDFARYVAAELAVNPWSRDVTVELVGVAAETVALNPRRVRHHDTADIAADVLADTVALIDRSNAADLDVATARATLLDDDLWDSRLLLLDASLSNDTTGQLVRLLHDHPRHTGTALILVGDHDERPSRSELIELTAGGRLLMPGVGLDLAAVGLTSDEAAGCAALFAQADEHADVAMPDHPEDADGWRALSNQAGQLRTDQTLPRDQQSTEPAASLLPAPDQAYLTVAATTVEDLAVLAPQVPVRVRHQVEKADPTLDDDLRTWCDPHGDLPRLMLLGPLTVRVAATGKPTVAAGRKPYLSELLAYLATRPHGATTDEVADAMRITTDRVRKDILTVRTWLGPNPRTGRPHIPDNRLTDAARTRGKGAYQVEGLLVDADLFRRLRARGETRGPDGLDDLHQALSLVTGTPFAQLRRDGGAWLAEGDRLDQILLCAIVDVAHLVTTASLQQGNPSQAQAAAELAARVAPDEETPRLDLAAVLEAQGHHQAAERLLREVCNRSDDEDGIPADLPPRTEHIIDDRGWLTRQGSKASA